MISDPTGSRSRLIVVALTCSPFTSLATAPAGINYKLYTVDLEIAPAWLPRRGLAGVGEAVEQPQLPRPLAPELVLRGGAVVDRGRAHARVGPVRLLVLPRKAPACEADAADRDHHRRQADEPALEQRLAGAAPAPAGGDPPPAGGEARQGRGGAPPDPREAPGDAGPARGRGGPPQAIGDPGRAGSDEVPPDRRPEPGATQGDARRPSEPAPRGSLRRAGGGERRAVAVEPLQHLPPRRPARPRDRGPHGPEVDVLDPVAVVLAAPDRDLDGPERPAVARRRGAAGAVQDPRRAARDQDAAAGPAVGEGVLDEADLEAGGAPVGRDRPRVGESLVGRRGQRRRVTPDQRRGDRHPVPAGQVGVIVSSPGGCPRGRRRARGSGVARPAG